MVVAVSGFPHKAVAGWRLARPHEGGGSHYGVLVPSGDYELLVFDDRDDTRLLRSEDPRVAVQLLDLEPWRPVSAMPPVRRDLSLSLDAEETAEDLGDRVRAALGARAGLVEAVQVVSETAWAALPAAARARLGMRPGQKNVLVRVVLRSLERTLTSPECNALRDEIYAALHQGSVLAWAARPPEAAERRCVRASAGGMNPTLRGRGPWKPSPSYRTRTPARCSACGRRCARSSRRSRG
jgi:hypothetical protein